MKYTSLDKMVKGYLLQKRYPIHFYVEFLVHAHRCFEELFFDSLGQTLTVKLLIDGFGQCTIPDDYMDKVSVGVINGQFVKPLVERPRINRLANYDTDGVTQILYPDVTGYGPTVGWDSSYSDQLEFTGRQYGAKIDRSDSYSIIPERNKIQLHQQIDATHIILEYISDGSNILNATTITPYAKSTFEAYINWKIKENGRSYSDSERNNAKRLFDQQHMKLRARLNSMTISDFKNAIYKNTQSAPK